MGTFGTDISENDSYLDLENEFFESYNQGIEVQTITKKIIANHNESFDSDEYSNDFWLAIADFQWQCKSLDKKVFEKVKEIIDSKNDLNHWKELDASEEDIKEREIKLNDFLQKISIPKKTAKRRIKKKLYNSIFKKGDLITYKLENGNYGGSLVIKDEKDTEFGLNLIILTDINAKEKPTTKTFKKSNIQYRKEKLLNGQVKYHPWILYFYGKYYEKEVTKEFCLEVIDNIEIKPFELDFNEGYFNWETLRSIPSIKANGLKLNNWIKNKNWLQQWL